MNNGALVWMHYGSNIGWAIGPLETTFYEVCLALCGDRSRVHFAYADLAGGRPRSLPEDFENLVEIPRQGINQRQVDHALTYISTHGIDLVFGFDLRVRHPLYRRLRNAGVKTIVAYWGAPMSSINSGVRLLAKRLDVATAVHGPDHFIFESEAMRRTAVLGRGIRTRDTSVVPLGVDLQEFDGCSPQRHYAHEAFGIPMNRVLVVYSGHIHDRKGIAVLMKAMAYLVNDQEREDIHLLVLGNKDGDERPFKALIEETPAADYVTFGGYRHDVPYLLASSDIGAVVSTGWDSFPRSVVEMQASGLPVVVSDLQGLPETVEDGVTGIVTATGNEIEVANAISGLADDAPKRHRFAAQARKRALTRFAIQHQRDSLLDTLSRIVAER